MLNARTPRNNSNVAGAKKIAKLTTSSRTLQSESFYNHYVLIIYRISKVQHKFLVSNAPMIIVCPQIVSPNTRSV